MRSRQLDQRARRGLDILDAYAHAAQTGTVPRSLAHASAGRRIPALGGLADSDEVHGALVQQLPTDVVWATVQTPLDRAKRQHDTNAAAVAKEFGFEDPLFSQQWHLVRFFFFLPLRPQLCGRTMFDVGADETAAKRRAQHEPLPPSPGRQQRPRCERDTGVARWEHGKGRQRRPGGRWSVRASTPACAARTRRTDRKTTARDVWDAGAAWPESAGIDFTHPDFSGTYVRGRHAAGWGRADLVAPRWLTRPS